VRKKREKKTIMARPLSSKRNVIAAQKNADVVITIMILMEVFLYVRVIRILFYFSVLKILLKKLIFLFENYYFLYF
jgi:hypothetical protein